MAESQEYKKEPTVVPYEDFNVAEDAKELRCAMKGLGTDEKKILDILCNRSNEQRVKIAEYFKNELDRDLIEDLKSELSFNFEKVIVALCTPSDEYLCRELRNAMEGLGTDEDALVEVLCPATNEEIKKLVDQYQSLFDRSLADDLHSETSGDFRKLLSQIVSASRDDSEEVDEERAKKDAQQLYDDGEGRWGTEESTFTRILTTENYAQLRKIFEEYSKLTDHTIEEAIRNETSSDYKHGLLAIVECVQCPITYYAKRLYKAMHGLGTDDSTLIRIIVSRSEKDLGTIKKEFERLYDKNLVNYVKDDTSGDYKRALVAILH